MSNKINPDADLLMLLSNKKAGRNSAGFLKRIINIL